VIPTGDQGFNLDWFNFNQAISPSEREIKICPIIFAVPPNAWISAPRYLHHSMISSQDNPPGVHSHYSPFLLPKTEERSTSCPEIMCYVPKSLPPLYRKNPCMDSCLRWHPCNDLSLVWTLPPFLTSFLNGWLPQFTRSQADTI